MVGGNVEIECACQATFKNNQNGGIAKSITYAGDYAVSYTHLDGAGAQNEHHIVLAHACTAGAVLADGQRLDQSGILPGLSLIHI